MTMLMIRMMNDDADGDGEDGYDDVNIMMEMMVTMMLISFCNVAIQFVGALQNSICSVSVTKIS